VKVSVLGYCNRAGVAGFGLALGRWVLLEWARGALSNGGISKRIGAVLSFRLSRLPLRSGRSTNLPVRFRS